MQRTALNAIEFFSGIGGFAQAAKGLPIKITQAFDQDQSANHVYRANYHVAVKSRNLDSIERCEIADSQLWWLSPPCTPYSSRGKRRDLDDPRAASLVHILSVLSELNTNSPSFVVLENVVGFNGSRAQSLLKRTLEECHYHWLELSLCPHTFGKPAQRPRYFILAVRKELIASTSLVELYGRISPVQPVAQPIIPTKALKLFLFDRTASPHLLIPKATVDKFEGAMNIIDPEDPDAKAICFTSNYGKYFRASGSFIREQNGRVRRFAPGEILRLLGFDQEFKMPDSISLTKQWKLIGNSLDIDCVRHLLDFILAIESSQL